ncbi:MAG TPA: flagellar biosynthetic protein FliO [Luteimonas sp.]|nr:flagellar biosynthetic protein FliO [Luteimonas sp.]
MTPTLVQAAQEGGVAVAGATEAPSFAGELMAILIPLVLVIIALLVVLRLARRRFRLTGQDAPLSVLQILPVGPRERLVLVKTRAGEVFAIGVGAQTVSFIREFDPVALGIPATDLDAGTEAAVGNTGGGWGRMHRGWSGNAAKKDSSS